jgi:hypothetical protein
MGRILFGEFILSEVSDSQAIRSFAEERLCSWFEGQEIQQYVRGVSYRIVLEPKGPGGSFLCVAIIRSKAMSWEGTSYGDNPFQAIARAFGKMTVSSSSLVRFA